eukprot:487733-Rhodomonas_salina.1
MPSHTPRNPKRNPPPRVHQWLLAFSFAASPANAHGPGSSSGDEVSSRRSGQQGRGRTPTHLGACRQSTKEAGRVGARHGSG